MEKKLTKKEKEFLEQIAWVATIMGILQDEELCRELQEGVNLIGKYYSEMMRVLQGKDDGRDHHTPGEG